MRMGGQGAGLSWGQPTRLTAKGGCPPAGEVLGEGRSPCGAQDQCDIQLAPGMAEIGHPVCA